MISRDLQEKREIEQSENYDTTLELISSIIPLGTIAYSFFKQVYEPLHIKKQREFLEDIASRIFKLEKNTKLDLAKLSESEEFHSIITRAILAIQKQHAELNKNGIKNIVEQTAKKVFGTSLKVDFEYLVLNSLEKLSSSHLTLLLELDKVLYKEGKLLKMDGEELIKLIDQSNLETGLIDKFWMDIVADGLVKQYSWEGLTSFALCNSPEITEFGKMVVNSLKSYEED